MSETRQFVERKDASIVKNIMMGIVGPLVVATVLGYISSYTTISRLTLVAEHQEKRMLMLEQGVQSHEKDYRELQLLVVRHSQIIDNIYRDMTALRGDYTVTAGRRKAQPTEEQ